MHNDHEKAPRETTPKVFLDYDQAALDAAYDQGAYAANRHQILARYAANSDFARSRLGEPRRVAYGPTPIEGFDLFTAARTPAPIHVFVHGGAWRTSYAKDCAFLAETFVRAGAHYAALDFISVDDTGGDLMPMAEHIRRAIAWIYRNAAEWNGDSNRIYLSGYSSGAHLAGVVLTTDWERDYGIPNDVIKGALLISGMYEMKPVRLSARGKYVKFTDAMEDAMSSQRHLSRLRTPVILAHGTLETPEFKRQTCEFAEALRNAGKTVEHILAPHCNHFEILETLANPYGLLGAAALRQMRLGNDFQDALYGRTGATQIGKT